MMTRRDRKILPMVDGLERRNLLNGAGAKMPAAAVSNSNASSSGGRGGTSTSGSATGANGGRVTSMAAHDPHHAHESGGGDIHAMKAVGYRGAPRDPGYPHNFR